MSEQWTTRRVQDFIADVEDSIDRERSHEEPAEHLCTLFEEAFDILRAQHAELAAVEHVNHKLTELLWKVYNRFPVGSRGYLTLEQQGVLQDVNDALRQGSGEGAGK